MIVTIHTVQDAANMYQDTLYNVHDKVLTTAHLHGMIFPYVQNVVYSVHR